MKFRERLPGLLILLLLSAVLFGFGLAFWLMRGEKGDAPHPTPTPGVSGVFLCERVTRDFVDFSVLNDVHQVVKAKSAFRDTASDPVLLLGGSLTTLFGFLSVPENEIPSWARELVDAQINTGKIDFSVLNEVYNRLRTDPRYQDLNDPARSEDVMISAIYGLLGALGDPFAYYETHQQYQLGSFNLSGSYKGIGVRIKREEGFIVIDSVFPGQPADRAGIKAGDRVLALDGKSAEGCSASQFTEYIKLGNKRSVVFTVRRDSREEDITVAIDSVYPTTVYSCPGVELGHNRGLSSRRLPVDCPIEDAEGNEVSDVLYIKFEEFSVQAFEDFALILESVNLSDYRGIVIDIRDNHGGLVNVTQALLDFFLDDEILYRQKLPRGDRDWEIRPYRQNRNQGRFTDLPIAVLVNGESASASEMFSASLKDNGRAAVVGERTTGKGAANGTFEFRQGKYGALHLAIWFFLSPNGDEVQFEDLNHNGHRDANEPGGVTPTHEVLWTDEDIRIKETENSNWDPVLFRAFEYINSGR